VLPSSCRSRDSVSVRWRRTQFIGKPVSGSEQIIGFYVVEAKNQDEAIAYAAKIPSAAVGSIEVRPIVGSA